MPKLIYTGPRSGVRIWDIDMSGRHRGWIWTATPDSYSPGDLVTCASTGATFRVTGPARGRPSRHGPYMEFRWSVHVVR